MKTKEEIAKLEKNAKLIGEKEICFHCGKKTTNYLLGCSGNAKGLKKYICEHCQEVHMNKVMN